MKYSYILFCCLLACACNNKKNTVTATTPAADALTEKHNFFPVTSYIKGQLFDIRQKGLTPVKYTTQNQHTDSVMIKFEMLDSITAEFIKPQIDTANLIQWFKETKFLDQTINAVTFTYEPRTVLPDTCTLRRWDVYIDPETGKVKRVYIIKKKATGKTLQLTWQSNKWCSIVTLGKATDETTFVEKEEKILWDY
jgi:hypothetical protein